jgi:hypothetical protein
MEKILNAHRQSHRMKSLRFFLIALCIAFSGSSAQAAQGDLVATLSVAGQSGGSWNGGVAKTRKNHQQNNAINTSHSLLRLLRRYPYGCDGCYVSRGRLQGDISDERAPAEAALLHPIGTICRGMH